MIGRGCYLRDDGPEWVTCLVGFDVPVDVACTVFAGNFCKMYVSNGSICGTNQLVKLANQLLRGVPGEPFELGGVIQIEVNFSWYFCFSRITNTFDLSALLTIMSSFSFKSLAAFLKCSERS